MTAHGPWPGDRKEAVVRVRQYGAAAIVVKLARPKSSAVEARAVKKPYQRTMRGPTWPMTGSTSIVM
jgi:hypothetical protein